MTEIKLEEKIVSDSNLWREKEAFEVYGDFCSNNKERAMIKFRPVDKMKFVRVK